MSYTSTVQYYTTYLTNMILEVTPSSWFKTVWTSMDPIHWQDPRKDASLSPTSTRAWRHNSPLKVARSTFLYYLHFSVFQCTIFAGPAQYLLDLLVSGHRSVDIALLLEPGTDGLKGAISTAPAIVIDVILHVVVVTVDSSNQIYLGKTHIRVEEEKFKLVSVPRNISR